MPDRYSEDPYSSIERFGPLSRFGVFYFFYNAFVIKTGAAIRSWAVWPALAIVMVDGE